MSAIACGVDPADQNDECRAFRREMADKMRARRGWRVSAVAADVQVDTWPSLNFFQHGADIERFNNGGHAYPYAAPRFHRIVSPFGPLFVLDYRSRYWLMDGDLIELFGMVLETQSERDFLRRVARRNLVRFAGRHALGGVQVMEMDGERCIYKYRDAEFYDHEAVLALGDLLTRFERDWPSVGCVRDWVEYNGIAKAVAAGTDHDRRVMDAAPELHAVAAKAEAMLTRQKFRADPHSPEGVLLIELRAALEKAEGRSK